MFENVAHLQAHRRARAFAKAADWITVSKDTESAKILLPLALQPLSDPSRDGVHADAARCVARWAARCPGRGTRPSSSAWRRSLTASCGRGPFSSKEKKASAAPASRKEKPSHQQQRLRTSRTLVLRRPVVCLLAFVARLHAAAPTPSPQTPSTTNQPQARGDVRVGLLPRAGLLSVFRGRRRRCRGGR